MTTYQDSSTDDKKEQAKQAAATAADEGKHVAGVAGEEAKAVAGEAKEHVKGLLDDTVTQVGEASKSQRDSLVSTLQGLTDDLQKMAGSEGGSGLAGELASQVADRAKSISSHLDGREPADLLNDVRDFARQRPGAFLLGALVAGVVAGRLARGAKAAQSDDSGPTAPSTPSAAPMYAPPSSYDAPVTAPVTPATTGFPTTPPVGGPLSTDTGAPGGFHA